MTRKKILLPYFVVISLLFFPTNNSEAVLQSVKAKIQKFTQPVITKLNKVKTTFQYNALKRGNKRDFANAEKAVLKSQKSIEKHEKIAKNYKAQSEASGISSEEANKYKALQRKAENKKKFYLAEKKQAESAKNYAADEYYANSGKSKTIRDTSPQYQRDQKKIEAKLQEEQKKKEAQILKQQQLAHKSEANLHFATAESHQMQIQKTNNEISILKNQKLQAVESIKSTSGVDRLAAIDQTKQIQRDINEKKRSISDSKAEMANSANLALEFERKAGSEGNLDELRKKLISNGVIKNRRRTSVKNTNTANTSTTLGQNSGVSGVNSITTTADLNSALSDPTNPNGNVDPTQNASSSGSSTVAP